MVLRLIHRLTGNRREEFMKLNSTLLVLQAEYTFIVFTLWRNENYEKINLTKIKGEFMNQFKKLVRLKPKLF